MSLLNHYRISLASSESLTPFPPARKQAQQTIIGEIVEYSSISQKQVVHVAT